MNKFDTGKFINTRTRRKKYATSFLMLLILTVLVAALAASCSTKREAITSVDQLNEKGRVIGVAAETSEGKMVEKEFPNAKIEYYKGEMQAYLSVSQGKADAFIFMKASLITAVNNGLTGVRVLDETVGEPNRAAVAFSPKTKIPDLEDKVNRFLEEVKRDGTLDDMRKRWVVNQQYTMPDIDVPEKSDVHLVVGTTGLNMPFTFYTGSDLNGYDIELARRFAAWLGASLEFKVYDYDGIIPAANSGDIDCIFADLFITPEREEAIKFSEPTFIGEIGVLVRDDSTSNPVGNIKSSFEKTFIRENRYKLFARGIGMTILIAFMSALCGTICGYLLFMACRHGNPVANGAASVFNWLMSGMPVVVLLMIMYYVVFASANISGALVSIIAFTMTFGAEVYAMMKTAVGAVDSGQMEAAYALGYTDLNAFFRHILPQAMPHFMPPFRSALINLIKATSIVGYIAVQDLTKTGDIIRSRTYEAFFPLIATAIIYFLLAGILVFAVDQIMKKLDPTKRREEDILKGVQIHD